MKMRHVIHKLALVRPYATALVMMLVITSGLSTTGPAKASDSSPLVTDQWLATNLDEEDLVVVDIRSKLSGNGREDFIKAHIPGAVYSDYLGDGWRVPNKEGIPAFLPSVDELETLFSRLGVWEDSHVVIVSGGKSSMDMAAAARVYWTFKVSGHEKVSILDGGFAGWKAHPQNALESGETSIEPTIYTVSFRPSLIADKDFVTAALNTGANLIDNRPANHFSGIEKHAASKRYGTIPGAYNIPHTALTRGAGGNFLPARELRETYAHTLFDHEEAQINFCNTGHWASLGWFVSHEIMGNKNARLYDGSIVEWSADPTAPMSQSSQDAQSSPVY